MQATQFGQIVDAVLLKVTMMSLSLQWRSPENGA
jgi:hypothetical protein